LLVGIPVIVGPLEMPPMVELDERVLTFVNVTDPISELTRRRRC
jgi:hypothetical protein